MIKIELQTKNTLGLFTIMSEPKIEGINIEIPPVMMTRALSQTWQIAIFTVLTPILANDAANLIEKYFGSDPTTNKITINREEIEYSKGEIIRVIKETKIIEHQ